MKLQWSLIQSNGNGLTVIVTVDVCGNVIIVVVGFVIVDVVVDVFVAVIGVWTRNDDGKSLVMVSKKHGMLMVGQYTVLNQTGV